MSGRNALVFLPRTAVLKIEMSSGGKMRDCPKIGDELPFMAKALDHGTASPPVTSDGGRMILYRNKSKHYFESMIYSDLVMEN